MRSSLCLHRNLLLLTDSYKITHWKQYPPDTTRVHSFMEARGGSSADVVFFGLQYYLAYLAQPVLQSDIVEAESYLTPHFGRPLMNMAGWQRIVDVHGGLLPLEIRAVPEGSVVPIGNVLMTVENLDPLLPWLTNYVESLLVQTWYPTTVATQSRNMKRRILQSLEETGTPALIDVKLHDFGFRGSTSPESAAIGGCAHLVNFRGSDTLPALQVAREVYREPCAGVSIPAAEHSTITAWGRAHELDAYRNMLAQFPTGLVAVVSDSYDVFAACREAWGGALREQVLERDGVLVVRPDSGDPASTILQVLQILGDRLGADTNEKGFTVLHPKVRVIQGDGITPAVVDEILTTLQQHGWSADNITFGSGGALLQRVHRDTHSIAFKCSAVERDGEWRDVMKDPIADSLKRSKAGRLALVRTRDGFATVRLDELGTRTNELRPVFRNGQLVDRTTLAAVRDRAALPAAPQGR